MIRGELTSRIDRAWGTFWSGGISNPLKVIEQITYLLFIRRLDDLQNLAEKQARYGGGSLKPVFPEGVDDKGRSYRDYRWTQFKGFSADELYTVVGQHVFPFLRQGLSGEDSTYAHHMRDARFTIPNAGLLAKVVDMLDGIDMNDRDTKGDLYEYMLSKIATAGRNGQFRRKILGNGSHKGPSCGTFPGPCEPVLGGSALAGDGPGAWRST